MRLAALAEMDQEDIIMLFSAKIFKFKYGLTRCLLLASVTIEHEVEVELLFY